MTQERLTMRKIAEVLRLKRECQLSNRAIARSCSISHSTVSEYLRRAQEAGLSWPLPADMGEDTLFELLFPKTPQSSSRVIPCPDWSLIHTELRKKSVTLRLLWVEYREAHPDGYGYSQFCALYREWAKCLKPSMRLSHNGPNETLYRSAINVLPYHICIYRSFEWIMEKPGRRLLLQCFEFLAVKLLRVVSKDDFLGQAVLCKDHEESIMAMTSQNTAKVLCPVEDLPLKMVFVGGLWHFSSPLMLTAAPNY